MDFEGYPINNSTDIASLDARVTTLENDVKTINTSITALQAADLVLQTEIEHLSHSAIYAGAPISTGAIFPTDITPTSNVIGSLFIPFAEINIGMSFRITIFGNIQIDVGNDFRLFIAQDTLGNFEMTPTDYENFGAVPTASLRKWEFIITFKTITGPATVRSTVETGTGNRFYTPSVDLNSLSSGVTFFILAQFRLTLGLQAFELLTVNLERIANF